MKKKVFAAVLASILALSVFAGCSKSSDAKEVRSAHAPAETTAAAYEEYYGAGDVAAEAAYDDGYYDDADYTSEAKSAVSGDLVLDNASTGTNTVTVGGNTDTKADAKKEMLVFRATIKLDTTDFPTTVAELKNKIAEYHGFIENEYQTDGSDYYGKYVVDKADKDYSYVATIRIPSEYYDSFVGSAEGLGYLRSKNTSVDNVSTVYGTLKSELEIYEAEYERYMKQYEETESEEIALEIQRELRNLAITISDIKTRMSSIESDVAYSYVSITIHQVTEEEIQEIIEVETEPDTFSIRVKKEAKESWESLLSFLEGVLMFFIDAWWGLLIFGLICLATYLIIRGIVKKIKKSNAKRAEAAKKDIEEREAKRRAEIEANKKAEEAKKAEAAKKAEEAKNKADNAKKE